jgi:hypothetical protein
MEEDEAPARDDGAGQKYRDAGDDADPRRGGSNDGVRKEALGDQSHEIGENENPRYRNAEEEADGILHEVVLCEAKREMEINRSGSQPFCFGTMFPG